MRTRLGLRVGGGCYQTWPPTSAWYRSVRYSAASVMRLMLRCRPRRWRLKLSAARAASRSEGSSLSRPESFSMPASESESELAELAELTGSMDEADWTLCIEVVEGHLACPSLEATCCFVRWPSCSCNSKHGDQCQVAAQEPARLDRFFSRIIIVEHECAAH